MDILGLVVLLCIGTGALAGELYIGGRRRAGASMEAVSDARDHDGPS